MKCKKKVGDIVTLKNNAKRKVIGFSKFFGDDYYKIKMPDGEGIIHISEVKGCTDKRPRSTKPLKEMIMRRGI